VPMAVATFPPVRTVLIVEPDHETAGTAAMAFRDPSWHSVVAADATRAAHLMHIMRFDVAVIDVSQPDLDAVRLGRELRQLAGDHRLRLVALGPAPGVAPGGAPTGTLVIGFDAQVSDPSSAAELLAASAPEDGSAAEW
jgi:CheY-like chemotaxis protein